MVNPSLDHEIGLRAKGDTFVNLSREIFNVFIRKPTEGAFL
jgi:hypothetical protein